MRHGYMATGMWTARSYKTAPCAVMCDDVRWMQLHTTRMTSTQNGNGSNQEEVLPD